MRKPGVPQFETFVERRIREAIERGEFDNLPGQGQPLPDLNGREDPNRWVKGLLEREQLPMPLPTSLALRREVRDLPQTLAGIRHEPTVRAMVEDLNARIRDSHRRRVDGPPVVTGLVDADAVVARWREDRSAADPAQRRQTGGVEQ